jgi:Calcineurin-like phosphoesterase
MKFLKPVRFIFILLCMIFLKLNTGTAQNSFKIFLVGDAGDHKEPGETLKNLQKQLIGNPNSAVIFLGDNSYKNILWGVIPFGYKGFDSTRNTMDKIRSQLSLLDYYKGSVFFIPGNHDWWNRMTYARGKNKLAMEESFIEENLKRNTNIANPANVFMPENGSYGPEYVELDNQTIRLIFIDTYRIIQTGIKKSKIPVEEIFFYKRLDSVIQAGYLLKQKIVVVAHHPVYSKGPVNKDFSHPYLFRRIKASYIHFPSYQVMASKINSVLQQYPGIYYASGHVHALQYFYTRDSVHYIISGAGSKENMLSEKEIIKYSQGPSGNGYLKWNSGGFFELEFNLESIHTFLYFDNAFIKCSLEDN